MQEFELTQKILAVGDTYEVRRRRAETGDAVVSTIRGKVLSMTPSLTMTEGEGGPDVASLKGNFLRSRFECRSEGSAAVGTLTFPTLALKRSFVIAHAGKEYRVESGLMGCEFLCVGEDQQPVLVIRKELALRDRFSVQVGDELPCELALLAAVAVDQRYFADT